MTIFKLNKEEFKKVNNDFKKTYIGQNINAMRIAIGILFILVFIQEVLTTLTDSFDLLFSSILLIAIVLYAIVEIMYFIIINIYYKDVKKNKKEVLK